MRIAQLSDFHYTHITWNPFRLFSKRILGNLNWVFLRKGDFIPGQLESIPDLLRKLEVDLILLGGDFSTTSLKKEFDTAAQFVKQLSSPWIAVPGNHDRYTKRACRGNYFYEYFSNKRKEISHPVEFFTLKDHGVEAHSIGENWWVVALDTAKATNFYSSKGNFSEKLEKHLEEVVQLIPKESFILLLNHYPFFQNDEPKHNLKRGDELQNFLKRHPRIRLYLHGHTHRNIVADLQPNNLPIILDSGSCAQGKKASWNLIELTPKGCQVDIYRWNKSWMKLRTEEFTWTRT